MRTRIKRVAESITTRVDQLVSVPFDEENELALAPVDQAQVARLTELAGQFKEALVPVTPQPAFQARLRETLLAAASQRLAAQKESRVAAIRRRWVLVGAGVGSALSVAGIVAAVLLHQRVIRL